MVMRRPKDMQEFDMILRTLINNEMREMRRRGEDPNKILNVSMTMTDDSVKIDFKEV